MTNNDNHSIKFEMPIEALEAVQCAVTLYQAMLLEIPPDERTEENNDHFDILVGLSDAFDHIITEREVSSGMSSLMSGLTAMLEKQGGK
ncbi:MAG: hypothetical protein EBS91_00175 [Betaproteobacteria bacterium]|jgi:hypothetical protein|nr:hypothetical protein [Betaproteobacteria bacterium]NCA23051.1 hypothetical protein [Betaproteobacteria bacterium]